MKVIWFHEKRVLTIWLAN